MISVRGADALVKAIAEAKDIGLDVRLSSVRHKTFAYIVDGVASPSVMYDDITGPMQLAEWLQQKIADAVIDRNDAPDPIGTVPMLDSHLVAVRQVHKAKHLMLEARKTLGYEAVNEIFHGYEPAKVDA